jgi:hypothetical protein
MNPSRNPTIARVCGLLATALFTLGAQAAVSTYTSSASFQSVVTTNFFTDFDDLVSTSYGQTLTTHGITITSLTGGHVIHDVYIDPPSLDNFAVASTSKVLDANGDENFKFQLANGASFNAIGFDFYANRYGAPSFSFYDSGSVLIATVTVNQTPSTLGFIGFTSTTPIAYMTSTVDQGWVQNTGYDNLRIGSVTAVPEPQSAGLLLAGLAAVAACARRRMR